MWRRLIVEAISYCTVVDFFLASFFLKEFVHPFLSLSFIILTQAYAPCFCVLIFMLLCTLEITKMFINDLEYF